jgi:hypothetical protein
MNWKEFFICETKGALFLLFRLLQTNTLLHMTDYMDVNVSADVGWHAVFGVIGRVHLAGNLRSTLR